MPPKNKAKKQKEEQSQEIQPQPIIEQIRSQKQTQKQTYYLVEWKGKPSQSEWEWKQAKELTKCGNYQTKFSEFLINKLKQKNVTNKEQSPSSPDDTKRKISIVRNAPDSKKKIQTQQQKSLDTFVKKILLKSESNQVPNPKQQSNSLLNPNQIQPPSTIGKIELELSKQKTQIVSQHNQSLNQKEFPKQTEKQPSFKALIDRIRGVKTIKSYIFKNNQIYYDVQVWDKNGQSFFIPPVPSETVSNLDRLKTIQFLQNCLVKSYLEDSKEKSSLRSI